MDESKKIEQYRIGAAVFIVLAMMTLGEFFIGAISPAWIAPLVGVAILKAFFIVRDYMHIGRLFEPEGEGNE